jgi:hypothetical protein
VTEAALDLFRTGEDLMRQRLRREHPELSPSAIEQRLAEWLRARPGAEFGDAPGTPIPWPRPRRRAGSIPSSVGPPAIWGAMSIWSSPSRATTMPNA